MRSETHRNVQRIQGEVAEYSFLGISHVRGVADPGVAIPAQAVLRDRIQVSVKWLTNFRTQIDYGPSISCPLIYHHPEPPAGAQKVMRANEIRRTSTRGPAPKCFGTLWATNSCRNVRLRTPLVRPPLLRAAGAPAALRTASERIANTSRCCRIFRSRFHYLPWDCRCRCNDPSPAAEMSRHSFCNPFPGHNSVWCVSSRAR